MPGFHKLIGRIKTKAGKAGATKGIAPMTKIPLTATDGTLTSVAASPEPDQTPELYSTAGPTGIRVVTDSADAELEYVLPTSVIGNMLMKFGE